MPRPGGAGLDDDVSAVVKVLMGRTGCPAREQARKVSNPRPSVLETAAPPLARSRNPGVPAPARAVARRQPGPVARVAPAQAVALEPPRAALYARFRSRDQEGTANKLLSAMRHAFGGHVEPKK